MGGNADGRRMQVVVRADTGIRRGAVYNIASRRP